MTIHDMTILGGMASPGQLGLAASQHYDVTTVDDYQFLDYWGIPFNKFSFAKNHGILGVGDHSQHLKYPWPHPWYPTHFCPKVVNTGRVVISHCYPWPLKRMVYAWNMPLGFWDDFIEGWCYLINRYSLKWRLKKPAVTSTVSLLFFDRGGIKPMVV